MAELATAVAEHIAVEGVAFGLAVEVHVGALLAGDLLALLHEIIRDQDMPKVKA